MRLTSYKSGLWLGQPAIKKMKVANLASEDISNVPDDLITLGAENIVRMIRLTK